jgi:hypothetical protein
MHTLSRAMVFGADLAPVASMKSRDFTALGLILPLLMWVSEITSHGFNIRYLSDNLSSRER